MTTEPERLKNTLILKCLFKPGEFQLMVKVFDQAIKGVWWMPWHREAKKDVVTCDKPRFAGSKLTRGFPNGETPPGKPR